MEGREGGLNDFRGCSLKTKAGGSRLRDDYHAIYSAWSQQMSLQEQHGAREVKKKELRTLLE